jgi:hypothetical protein
MPRPVLSLFTCAAALSVGACNLATDTSGGGTPVAILVLNTRTKGAGYTTSPTANFYRAQNITFSSAGAATDSCVLTGYDPNGNSSISATIIGGGAFVLAAVSGRTDSLKKSLTDATYRSSLVSGIDFTPGDSVAFTIVGDAAGFPASNVTAKTAEKYSLDPIIVPTAGQPMTVTWTPASDGNAAMLFSFRYNDGTGSGLNTQIFCDFRDDGSGVVQAANIARWAAASQRDVLSQRLRTALVRVPITSDAFVNVLSTYDVPTPVSP